MTVFRGGYEPCITTGLMHLHSVKQTLFCISQHDNASQEMDTYTLLGISGILEEAGYNVEAAYNRLDAKWEAAERRHAKLRAALAEYMELGQMFSKADLAKILADDEKGGSHDA